VRRNGPGAGRGRREQEGALTDQARGNQLTKVILPIRERSEGTERVLESHHLQLLLG
jgi:hypothetical protein